MSKIFHPYRALGLCSTSVPFVVKFVAHSNTYNALVPVGDTFNVYQLPRLTLVGISDSAGGNIRSFTACGSWVFAAVGSSIYVYRNQRYLVRKLTGHQCEITHLLAFSQHLLASVDVEGTVNIWDIRMFKVVFEMQFQPKSFNISVVFCPLGYVNKLLLGSLQGPLQLWNVKSQKHVYWFKGFGSAVTCIQQAPAFDVCAIGLDNGRVCLHNIRFDISLMTFSQDGGAVTAIDFRTGSHGLTNPSNVPTEDEMALFSNTAEDLYMVVGSEIGQLSSWLLKENGESHLVGRPKLIHHGRVTRLYCISGGDSAGAMLTAGADNSIKVYYFNRPDGNPEALYKRSGHSQPPVKVQFWPGGSAGGRLLLSAGQESVLRVFSMFNHQFDRSLGRTYAPGVPSRGSVKAEERTAWLLPPVSQMSLCAARAEDWDSLVVLHVGKRQATTWNFVNATRGRHWLDPAKFSGQGGAAVRMYKHTIATAVWITNCGNYVLIGYSSGDVFKFNLQSGLERGSYGSPTAHTGKVVGISVNNVNRQTVTVGDCEVRFWGFHKHELLKSLDLPSKPLLSRFHGDSDTLAVALENGTIIVLDSVHRHIIRRFPNPNAQNCVDFTISSNGRWLISAHGPDPLIKTWDIVDGSLIDCFRVNKPITSLALAPANEFLATTHVDSMGVCLWDNWATYRRLQLQPLPVDYVPPAEQKPTFVPSRSLLSTTERENQMTTKPDETAEVTEGGDEEFGQDDIQEPDGIDHISPEQLQDRLATLSGLPASYFNSFIHLDIIRERNRTATAPTQTRHTANLPFFLPVMETDKGLAWKEDNDKSQKENETSEVQPTESSGVRKRHSMLDDGTLSAIEPVQGLSVQLIQAKEDSEFDEIAATLKQLSPSALDLEIRLLAPSLDEERAAQAAFVVSPTNSDAYGDAVSSRGRLHGFLRFLINRFERNLDIDFACVCLSSVMDRYSDLMTSAPARTRASDEIDHGIETVLESESVGCNEQNQTLELVAQAVQAKSNAQSRLTQSLTRTICLVDFIRNPTTALQF